jgi:diaminohydroxyphosphoribosylaminopyrimidine deaminase/5-amino-6-(5-phosphoribosylamino)uracil reductase
VDAVLTAIGTVLADDPLLTARFEGGRSPRRVARRVVIDPRLELPLGSRMVASAFQAPVLVATTRAAMVKRGGTARALAAAGVEVVAAADDGDIPAEGVLRHLASTHDASSVLVEAGPGLLGRMFAADLVDEALVFIAPMLVGDEQAVPVARGRAVERLSDARVFGVARVKRLGDDVVVRYVRRRT